MKYLSRIKRVDSNYVKNAFFANYLSSLIMLKLHDLKGLSLVRDKAHCKITKFDNSMSELNFWGRVLFYPHDILVKKNLSYGHADILETESGRIMTSRINAIMYVPIQDPRIVNWEDTVNSLIVLKHRYNLKSSFYHNIVYALKNWNVSKDSAKRKAVGDCFLYLTQSDPKSNLISHFRELAGTTMINDLRMLAMKVVSIKRLGECRMTLSEDGEVVSTSEIANQPFAIFGGENKIIKRAIPNTISNETELFSDKKTDYKSKQLKKRAKKFKITRFKKPEFMNVENE